MATLKAKINGAWQHIYTLLDLPDQSVPQAKITNLTTDLNAKALKTQLSNPNLLDNPWFSVNQRGVSSNWTTGYGVDRWRTGRTVVNKVTNGLSITWDGTGANGYLQYIFDKDFYEGLIGQNITLSMNVDGQIYFSTGIAPSVGNVLWLDFDDGAMSMDINYENPDAPFFSFRTKKNSSVILIAVKLELGSVSTLANDTAPNYALELAKCQRYAVKFTGGAYQRVTSGQTTSSLIDFIIPLPMPLYISPSIESGSFNVYKFTSSGSAEVTGLTASIIGASGDSPFVGIRFTGSGLTATDRYFLNMTNVILSADL